MDSKDHLDKEEKMVNLVHRVNEENKDLKVNQAPTDNQDHLDLVEKEENPDQVVTQDSKDHRLGSYSVSVCVFFFDL